MGEAKQADFDDYDDVEIDSDAEVETEEKTQSKRSRSIEFESKKRRAERILEQARLRELLGYDVDYED